MGLQSLLRHLDSEPPILSIALGEMTEARNLLLLLLSSVSVKESDKDGPPIPNLPSKALTATTVTKPPPIQSVQTFDAQLVIGSKDESLRKAANLFKATAVTMEESRLHREQYWANALKIRKDNWGLLPAPLPFGSFLGKGADKTSSDFLVSFGMEECQSHARSLLGCFTEPAHSTGDIQTQSNWAYGNLR